MLQVLIGLRRSSVTCSVIWYQKLSMFCSKTVAQRNVCAAVDPRARHQNVAHCSRMDEEQNEGIVRLPSKRDFQVISLGARPIIRNACVKYSSRLSGVKKGNHCVAWFRDGLVIERKPKRKSGMHARISVYQENFSEGDGAAKFKLEWSTASDPTMRRITRCSLHQLFKDFASQSDRADSMFRVSELCFSVTWFSENICSREYTPSLLENCTYSVSLQESMQEAVTVVQCPAEDDAPTAFLTVLSWRSCRLAERDCRRYELGPGIECQVCRGERGSVATHRAMGRYARTPSKNSKTAINDR